MAISRSAALAKAAAVLAAAHVTEPLGPPEAQEDNMTSPPQRQGHDWYVLRRRQAQGVAFQDQQATVILQAEKGAVLGLGVTFPTPPPPRVEPRLTPAQAVASAQSALTHGDSARGSARIGFGPLRPFGPVCLTWVTPEVESVTPDVNGVVNSPPPPIPARKLPARLIWMCFFRDAQSDQAFLPVDAVTGEALTDQAGFSWGPRRLRPRATSPAAPLVMPAPPTAVVDHPVAATILPGATVAPPPPNVPRYRLSLTDIYAPLTALTALGFGSDPLRPRGGETDQTIARKLEQAGRDGKLILVPGPNAVVPEGGVWGLTRTREALCKAPIYWQPRPVPGQILMKFSVTPKKQPDGSLYYRSQVGTEATAAGKSWSGNWGGDSGAGGGSRGDVGATTVLCGLEEEHYSWETGVPSNIKSDGILHILLVHGELLP